MLLFFKIDMLILRSIFLLLLATLCSMWDLSSLTKDQTHAPCNGSSES